MGTYVFFVDFRILGKYFFARISICLLYRDIPSHPWLRLQSATHSQVGLQMLCSGYLYPPCKEWFNFHLCSSSNLSISIYELCYQYQFMNYAPQANLCADDITLSPYMFNAVFRIHVFLGLPEPDPDPLVRGMDPDPVPALDPDPSIIKQI
jgi:hypothetical protein